MLQEYIDIIYDEYDTSILYFPTAAGVFNNLFNKLYKELKEKRQTVLFLVRNRALLNDMFNTFGVRVGCDTKLKSINTFIEFDNGSVIFFKIFNQVESTLFKHSDTIVLFNLEINQCSPWALEFIDKIKNFNKKIIINCQLKYNVENVMLRRFGGEQYKKVHNYDISDIPMIVRRFKLKKLKEKCKTEI